jgi:hypothetical protein
MGQIIALMLWGTYMIEPDNWAPTHETYNPIVFEVRSEAYYSRPLFKFDNSDRTPVTRISSVNLKIYGRVGANGKLAKVQRVLRNATDKAAFATYDGTNTWAVLCATGTGDVDASSMSSTNVAVAAGWMTFPLDIAKYIEARDNNNALILSFVTGNSPVVLIEKSAGYYPYIEINNIASRGNTIIF